MKQSQPIKQVTLFQTKSPKKEEKISSGVPKQKTPVTQNEADRIASKLGMK